MTKPVPMLLWALMASGQIQMHKVDGWETLLSPSTRSPLTTRPDQAHIIMLGGRRQRISTRFEDTTSAGESQQVNDCRKERCGRP